MVDASGGLDIATLPGFPCRESHTGSRELLYLGSKLPQQATAFLLHTKLTISTEVFWIICHTNISHSQVKEHAVYASFQPIWY